MKEEKSFFKLMQKVPGGLIAEGTWGINHCANADRSTC